MLKKEIIKFIDDVIAIRYTNCLIDINVWTSGISRIVKVNKNTKIALPTMQAAKEEIKEEIKNGLCINFFVAPTNCIVFSKNLFE